MNEPFMQILEEDSVEKMGLKVCDVANNQLFAKPSCSLFDLNKFIRVMCQLNYSTLEKEMEVFMSLETKDSLDSEPASISSIMISAENLWNKMNRMMDAPNKMEMWKPLNTWMNQKPRIDAMMAEFKTTYSKIFDLSSLRYLSYIETMVNNMMFDMQPITSVIHIEKEIVKFINLNLEAIIQGKSKLSMNWFENSELEKLISMISSSQTATDIITENIFRALQDPRMMAAMLDFKNWQNMCNNTLLLSMMFPQGNSRQLCDEIFSKINMTAVDIQIDTTFLGIKDLFAFISSFRFDKEKDVNYTAVAVENIKLVDLLSQVLMNSKSKVYPNRSDLKGSMMINMVLKELSGNWDIIASSLTSLSSAVLIQNFKSHFNSSRNMEKLKEFNYNMVIQYNIVKFLNHHLNRINSSPSNDILYGINSTELRKLLKHAEQIPGAMTTIPYIFLNVVTNPKNLPKLIDQTTWKTICTDKKVFNEMFSTSIKTTEIERMRKVFCDIIMKGTDPEKLNKELMDNLPGYKELIEAVMNTNKNNTNLMPDMFQKLIQEVKVLQDLITSFDSRKLDVLLGTNAWFSKENFRNISKDLENIWVFTQEYLLKSRSEILEQYLTAILNTNISNSQLLKFKVSLYQQQASLKFINTRLENIIGNGSFDLAVYVDKPLLKAIELFDNNSISTKLLFEILFKLIENPLKLEELLETKDWDSLCKNLTQIPLCDSNILKLGIQDQILSLVKNIQGFNTLTEAFNTSLSIKDPSLLNLNISNLVKEIEHFENQLTSLKTIPVDFNRTRVDNTLEKLIKAMGNKLSQEQWIFYGPFPGFDVIDDILNTGYGFLPSLMKKNLVKASKPLMQTQIIFQFFVSDDFIQQFQTIQEYSSFLEYLLTSVDVQDLIHIIQYYPDVTDFISKSLLDFIQDPKKLNDGTLNSACRSATVFQSLIPSSLLSKETNVTVLQRFFCKHILKIQKDSNFTNHFIKLVKNLSQLMKQLKSVENMNLSSYFPVAFYKDSVKNSMQLIKLLNPLLKQNNTLLKSLQTEYLKTLQMIIVQWDNIGNDFDIESVMKIVNEINKILNSIPNELFISEDISKVYHTSILMQYYTIRFLNIHLNKIKGLDKLVLLDYVKSNELKKLFGLVEMAPDFFKILSHSLYRLIQNPNEVQKLLSQDTLDNLCTNISIFENVFDTKLLRLNTTNVHQIVCNKVLLETRFMTLEKDLNQNVEGFKAYLNDMKAVINNPSNTSESINYVEIAKAVIQFENLIESLLKKPPHFSISSDNDWMKPESYEKIVQILMSKFNGLGNGSLVSSIQAIHVYTIQSYNVLRDPLGLPAQNMPLYIEQKVTEFLLANLNIITESPILNTSVYTQSPELNILLGLVEMTPELSAKLATAGLDLLMNPERLVPFVENITLFDHICSNKSLFQTLFPLFKENWAIEDACKIIGSPNLDKLYKEIQDTFPGFNSLVEMYQYLTNYSHNQEFPVNYKKLLEDQKQLQMLISKLLMNPPKIVWEIEGNLTWESFNSSFHNMTGAGLLKFVSIPQVAGAYGMQLFDTLSKPFGIPYENMQAFIEQKVVEFLTANLVPISDSHTFNMHSYIKSPELRSLLGLVEMSPELTAKLAKSGLELLIHPERLVLFLKNITLFDHVCSNKTLFQMLFPSFKDDGSIENACKIIGIPDMDKLLKEVNATLPGFSSLVEMYEHLANYSTGQRLPVDYKKYATLQIQLEKSITKLIYNPPKFVWGISEDLTWDSFRGAFNNMSGGEILKTLSIPQVASAYGMQLFDTLSKPFGIPYENMEAFIEQKVVEFLTANLVPISDSPTFNMHSYIKSSELRSLLGLVEMTPELTAKLAKSGLELLIHPERLVPFLKNITLFDHVCSNKTLFKMLFPSFKDDGSIEDACKIIGIPDMDKLFTEVNATLPGFSSLVEMYEHLANYSTGQRLPVDYKKYATLQIQLEKSITKLIYNPPKFVWGISEDLTWDSFRGAFNNMSGGEILKTLSIPQAASAYGMQLFDTLSKPFGIPYENMQAFIEQKVVEFLTANLVPISDSPTFNMHSYIKSPELRSLLGLVEMSPELTAKFAKSGLELLIHPERLVPFLKNITLFDYVCSNKTLFKMLFPSFKDDGSIEDACKIIGIPDMDKLFKEVNATLPGFSSLVEMYEHLANYSTGQRLPVDYKKYATLQIQLEKSITKLIYNPPKFVWGISEDLTWDSFRGAFNNMSGGELLKTLSIPQVASAYGMQLFDTLSKPFGIPYENMQAFIEQKVVEFLTANLVPISDSPTFNMHSYIKSPELRSLLGLVEMSPELTAKLAKSGLELLIHPERYEHLANYSTGQRLPVDYKKYAMLQIQLEKSITKLIYNTPKFVWGISEDLTWDSFRGAFNNMSGGELLKTLSIPQVASAYGMQFFDILSKPFGIPYENMQAFIEQKVVEFLTANLVPISDSPTFNMHSYIKSPELRSLLGLVEMSPELTAKLAKSGLELLIHPERYEHLANYSTGQRLLVDYKKYATLQIQLEKSITKLIYNPPKFVWGISEDLTWDSFRGAFNNISGGELLKTLSMPQLVNVYAMQFYAILSKPLGLPSESIQTFIEHKVVEFLIANLQNIGASPTFNVTAYIQSPELKSLLGVVEMSPELIAKLATSGLDIILNPQRYKKVANYSMDKHFPVNYQKLVNDHITLQLLISKLISNPPQLVWDINEDLIWDSVIEVFTNMTDEKILKELSMPRVISIYIMHLISTLSKPLGLPIQNMQSYIEYKVLEFLVANLKVISASPTFNMHSYIQSAELRSLVGLVEMTPKITSMLAVSALEVFMNPERLLPFIKNATLLEHVCSNKTLFQMLFPSFKDDESIENACKIIRALDLDKLYKELQDTLPGFNSLVEMYKHLEKYTPYQEFPVNYKLYAKYQVQAEELITKLVMNPPSFVWGINANLTWQAFTEAFDNRTGGELQKLLSMPIIIPAYLKKVYDTMSGLLGLPSQNTQRYIELKVLEFLVTNLKPISESPIFNMSAYIKSPELNDLLVLAEISPDLAAKLVKSGLELLMNPERDKILTSNTSNLNLTVDYKTYAMYEVQLQNIMSNLIMNPPKFVLGINSDLTWNSFTEAFNNMTSEYFRKTLSMPQVITAYVTRFYHTLSTPLKVPSANFHAYIEQKTSEFIVANLKQILTLTTFNMSAYIQSPELKSLLGLVEMTPELTAKLATAGLDLFIHPERLVPLVENITLLDHVCSNKTLFQMLFPLFKDDGSIEDACKIIGVPDLDKLYKELQDTLPGFNSLVEMYKHLANSSFDQDFPVNYTAYTRTQIEIEELITKLLKNPPKFVWGINEDLTWDSFNSKFNNMSGGELLKILSFPQVVSTYAVQFYSTLAKPLGLPPQNMEAYIELKITEFLVANMRAISTFPTFNMLTYIKSPELRTLVGLVDMSPELLAKLAASGFDLLIHPERILQFIENMTLLNHVCSNETLFESLFPLLKDDRSIKDACKIIGSLNLDKLFKEVNASLPGFSSLVEMYKHLEKYSNNYEFPVNYTALANYQIELDQIITHLTKNPPKFVWGINEDMTWNSFIETFRNITDLQKIFNDPILRNGHLIRLFSTLSMSTTFINQTMEIYIEQHIFDFLNANLKRILASGTFNMFDYIKSPEIKQIIGLVRISPEAASMLIKESLDVLMNPQRVLINNRTWEKLCDDPVIFRKLFPSFKYQANVQSLCTLIKTFDLGKFSQQLNQTLPGYSSLSEMYNVLKDYDENTTLQVDYITHANSRTLFEQLLMKFISDPPKFTLGFNMTGFNDPFSNIDEDYIIQYSVTGLMNYLAVIQNIDIAQLPIRLQFVIQQEIIKNYIMLNLLDFFNQNIQKLEENSYSIIEYLNATELIRFTDLIDNSPATITLLSNTFISLIMDPLKVQPLLDENNWMNMCKNETIFKHMFDLTSEQNNTEFFMENFVACSEVFNEVNMQSLMDEVKRNIPGWSKLINKLNISIDDPNLKVDVELAKKNLLYFIGWLTNLEKNVIKLNFGNYFSKLSTVSLIFERFIERMDTFGNSIEVQSLTSLFQFLKLLNNIDAFPTSSLLGNPLQMINKNMARLQYLLQFMNIQLKNMSGSSNFDETSLAQSVELLKLFGHQSNISEDSVAIILTTILKVLQDPSRVFNYFEKYNWNNLCNSNNTNTFTKIFAVDQNQDPLKQQQKFCQEVISQIDPDILLKQLSSLEGFNKFYLSVIFDSNDLPLDLSLLICEANKFQQLMNQMIDKPFFWIFTNVENIMNSTRIKSLLNMLKQEVNGNNNGTNEIDKFLIGVSEILKQASTMPEWKQLMSSATIQLQSLNKMISQLTGSVQNIKILEGKPELESLIRLLLNSPEMVSSVAYNMILKQREFINALQKISGSKDPIKSICQTLETINMTSIPNSNFDLNSYLSSFCSINFTILELEISQLSKDLNVRRKRESEQKNNPSPHQILSLIQQVWEMLSNATNSNQSDFWEPTNKLLKTLILQFSSNDYKNGIKQEDLLKIISILFDTTSNQSRLPVKDFFQIILKR
ncbi:hypothetical protein Ahia01_000186300, partial [Argonauta hians]